MNKELLVVTNKKMIKIIWEAHNNGIAELNNKIINKDNTVNFFFISHTSFLEIWEK